MASELDGPVVIDWVHVPNHKIDALGKVKSVRVGFTRIENEKSDPRAPPPFAVRVPISDLLYDVTYFHGLPEELDAFSRGM